jgi:hypothetical protein
MATGCSASSSAITGTVVDAETSTPIEGAVLLVEWTKTKGVPGMSATEVYKAIEAVTDKDGKFFISGLHDLFVNPPRVTIYKKNYVGWNIEYIFPNYRKRTDFKWEEGIVIKLEPYKEEYSRTDHVFFLHGVTHWGKLINEAYRWEELETEQRK